MTIPVVANGTLQCLPLFVTGANVKAMYTRTEITPRRIGSAGISSTLSVLARFGAAFTGDGECPVQIELAVVDALPEPIHISISSPDGKAPITPAQLRSFAGQLGQLVDAATASALVTVSPAGSEAVTITLHPDPSHIGEVTSLRRRRHVTPELLADVAAVWSASDRSADAVAAHFVVSQRTAYRWIDLAREAGLLEGADNGQC